MKKLIFILTLTLFSIALLATDVSGQQSGVWTLANSPYNIIGNVEVPVGSSLQIEPGVMVVATGNYRLNVKGSITAVGTPADSIRFVSGMTDPDATWKGIRVQDATQPSIFAYIYVEKAEIGVNCNNSPVTVSHSRFYQNEKGIRFYGMGNPEPPFMEAHNNLVEYSEENGILIHQQSNAHVHHNEVRYNATSNRYWGAIQLTNQTASGSNSPEISYNHIHHNVKQGIIAWDLTGGSAIAPYVHHNLIEHNVTGIYLLHASGHFEGNIIRNNTAPGADDDGVGVMLGGASTLPYFEDNEIYGNYCGFYIGENTNPVLGDLSSDHEWAGGGNQIYDNSDLSNVPHSIVCFSYTDPTIVIKAENNYWGTNDQAVINTSITDQLDDPTLPLVDYDPWLANPPSGTSISGTVTNPTQYALENCTLMVVGVASGEVCHSFPVEIGTAFDFALDVDEDFYVVARAEVAGWDWLKWTGAETMYELTIFEPGAAYEVGELRFQQYFNAWHKYTVGEPVQIDGRSIYPVQHRYYVFKPDYTNWFYDVGDYRYIHAHTRHYEDGNLEFTFPENSTYAKIFNIEFGDTWQRHEIIDDAGTIRTSNISYLKLEDGAEVDKFPVYALLQADSTTGKFISITDRRNDFAMTSFFDADGYLCDVQTCSGVAFDFPLQTGLELKHNDHVATETAPSWLVYDTTKYFGELILDLYWIPPANEQVYQWTHYNIYANDNLVASTDDFTPFISITNPVQNAVYEVKASDGTNESESHSSLYIPVVSNDDPILPPTTLSVYPNPFSAGMVKIKLEDPKGQSGCFSVYNLRGQKVYTQDFAKGEGTELSWNGKDQKGVPCGSGIYLLKIDLQDGRSFVKRMVKLRF